ncbi:hypothetical protein LUZ60_001354 [Juncus effusus]|nr:hypothetical protein LUZ60_001354 [Juncus effusus]
MGSLPSFSLDKDVPLPVLYHSANSQVSHFTHSFRNLNFPEVQTFAKILLNAPGAIFFSGVGKSSNVALEWAETFASLGIIRSSYLCPLKALHGNLGSLFPNDILVLLSKSGASEELIKLVPFAKTKGAYIIAVTSSDDGKGGLLGKVCDTNVHLPLSGEICPFGLAPLTSPAVHEAFGGIIVASLMETNRLSKEHYATNHPAGRIGKRLILKVKDVMKKKSELPLCKESDMIMEQLAESNNKGCGCLLVIDDSNRLIGTFTDGDLRRTLVSSGTVNNLTVGQVCNRNPRTITADMMAVEAMEKMESAPSPVQFLPVIDGDNIVIGIVTLHGLVSAGL